jgi:hypothetical protein
MVLFSVDQGYPTVNTLRSVLGRDGKERNLPWALSGDIDEILRLQGPKLEAQTEDEEGEEVSVLGQRRRDLDPARWIITFRDTQEARRFVRSWHGREFPSMDTPQPDDEPPVASAELLW